MKDEEQEAAKFDAVFPCILRILPNCVFNKKDPIVVGVDIEEGIAKAGPLHLCMHAQLLHALAQTCVVQIVCVCNDEAQLLVCVTNIRACAADMGIWPC